MKLIGLVNYPRQWPWKELPLGEVLKYLIVEDPKVLVDEFISIGKSTKKTINPNQTGLLWVFANDWWKYYDNNTGSVWLTVKRIA